MNLFLLQQTQYFKQDDPLAGILILSAVGAIVVVVFVSNLLKNGIGAGKIAGGGGSSPRKFSVFALHRTAKEYNLNRDQANLLEYVLKSGGVTDPERAVANPMVLDKHFKRVFKQIEKSANSEEEAQQRLALLFSVRNTIEVRHNTSPDSPSAQRISSNMAAVLTANQESYSVKVISSKGENILVDCPRNAIGSLIRFPKGTRANLAFFTRTSKGFSYDCQVAGMADTSFGPALQLVHSGRVKSMTQRRFRRRQGTFPCDFFLVRLEDLKNKKPPKMVVDSRRMSGSVTDISIGGCAIKTQNSVPAGSRLKIELDCAPGVPVAVLGQVLRINRSGIANTIMHVKFLKIPRKAMNAINAAVFEYGAD
ncbi:MAG: PilZ domain-containing protein [Spirochaetaceae bacterium]|jgi:hypothetical protein|nr:PilZ domain-containing protein [Spirochaetaceae bacterium]